MVPDLSFAMFTCKQVQEIFVMGGFPAYVNLNCSCCRDTTIFKSIWQVAIMKTVQLCHFTNFKVYLFSFNRFSWCKMKLHMTSRV